MIVNDKVQVKTEFLRSIFQYTGDICFAKGIITDIKTIGQSTIVYVCWDKNDIPPKWNINNLSKVN